MPCQSHWVGSIWYNVGTCCGSKITQVGTLYTLGATS